MLSLAPTGGRACGTCWLPCGSRGPCPYSLAPVQTGIVPSLCRRGNGGSEKSCGGVVFRPGAHAPGIRFHQPQVRGSRGHPTAPRLWSSTPRQHLCAPPTPAQPGCPRKPGRTEVTCGAGWQPSAIELLQGAPPAHVSCLCFLRSEPRVAPLCCPLPRPLPLNKAATPHGSGQLSRGPRPPIPANAAHKAHVSPP